MYQIFIVLEKPVSLCTIVTLSFRNTPDAAWYGVHISINIWKPIINFWYTLTLPKSAHQDNLNHKEAYILAFECKNTRNTSNTKPKSSYGDIIHPLFHWNTKDTPCANEPTKATESKCVCVCGGVRASHLNDRKHLGKKLFKSLMKNRPFNFRLRKRTVLTWNNFNYGFITFVKK